MGKAALLQLETMKLISAGDEQASAKSTYKNSPSLQSLSLEGSEGVDEGVGGFVVAAGGCEVVGVSVIHFRSVGRQLQPGLQDGSGWLATGWLGMQALKPLCQYQPLTGQEVPEGGAGGFLSPPWGRQQSFSLKLYDASQSSVNTLLNCHVQEVVGTTVLGVAVVVAGVAKDGGSNSSQENERTRETCHVE